MKRIVFINQDSGYLMIDIINTFAESGYECVLLTGRLVERNKRLNEKVKVDKIIRYNRNSTFRRLYTWLTAFLQILIRVSFKYRNDNLFIVSNPPLAPLLPLMVNNNYQLLIFDIYPDVLTEANYLSVNSSLIRAWKWANRRIYPGANSIFTITDSMRDVLRSYSGNKKITVIPVWTDNTFLKPVDRSINPFLIKHNLQGKFIVMYSGNIGLSGDTEIMTLLAAKMEQENVLFLLIGDGAKKEIIRKKSEDLRLKNFIMLPWQQAVDLPYSLSSASLAVLFHGTKTSKLAIPSKLFNYLSVGAPLLCIAPKDSEVSRLINRHGCGKSFEIHEVSGMVNFIGEISANKQLQMLMSSNSLKLSEVYNQSNVKGFLPVADDL